MFRRKLKTGLTIAIVGLSGNALAFTTDGDLNDWLDSGGSWATIDDNRIGIDRYAPGNAYGGHPYDAERLLAAVDWSSNTLYVAVITGLSPNSGVNENPDIGTNGWRPGDLAIYTGANHNSSQLWNVYSTSDPIDWNTSSWPSGDLESATTDNPNVYGLFIPDEIDSLGTLDNDGDPDPDGNTGPNPVERDVVQGARWYTNERSSSQPEMVASMVEGQGTPKGDKAEVVYTEAKYDGVDFKPSGDTEQHYIIEMAIGLTSLGWTQGQDTFNVALHWGMNCSNDWIAGNGSWTNTGPSGTPGVPEPTALALMALGLVGVGYGRKRRTTAES